LKLEAKIFPIMRKIFRRCDNKPVLHPVPLPEILIQNVALL
jgi:hypothetical protein